ncbi:MAG TPA: metallophosphoesterase [Cyclobacteriaceae bacterium]|nr:metallophosphoesterase [Cyclobacteriaceae bacterium]
MLGDTHFDTKFPYSTSPDPMSDLFFLQSVKSFTEIIRYAARNGFDILHAGDFFNEGSIGAPELAIVIQLLQGLQNKGIQMYVNLGNHDTEFIDKIPASIESLAKMFPNIHVAERKSKWTVFPWYDYSVYMIPYCGEIKFNKVFEELMQTEIKSPAILCIHEDIKGVRMGSAQMKTGLSEDAFCDVAAKRFNMIVCGHMHQAYEATRSKVPLIVPGSTHAVDFRDEGIPKRFYEIIYSVASLGRIIPHEIDNQIYFKTIDAGDALKIEPRDLSKYFFRVRAPVGTDTALIKEKLGSSAGVEMEWGSRSVAPDLTGYERPKNVTMDEWLCVFAERKGYSYEDYEEARDLNKVLFDGK